MQPNAVLLRELVGDRDVRSIGAEACVDPRTIVALLSGVVTDRFQFNTIYALAMYFKRPMTDLVEVIPESRAGTQLRQRHISSAQAEA